MRALLPVSLSIRSKVYSRYSIGMREITVTTPIARSNSSCIFLFPLALTKKNNRKPTNTARIDLRDPKTRIIVNEMAVSRA